MFVLLLLSGAFAELRKPFISLDMSFLLPAWNISVPSGRMYEIWRLGMFGNAVENLQVSLKSDKNTEYFTWRLLDIFDHIYVSSS